MGKQVNCPCCGSPIKSHPLSLLAAVVTPTMGEIVEYLSKKPGQFISKDELASFVWRRDPHGGPRDARSTLVNVIGHNRHRLNALGWNIEGRLGRNGGLRLVVHENARNVEQAHG